VSLLQPWGQADHAAASDSPALCAKGGGWHKKDRTAGSVPHATIETEAPWSKAGYQGGWYGWKRHLACTATVLWIPQAAQLTPANVADQDEVPALIRQRPPQIQFVLGDTHYNEPAVRLAGAQDDRFLVATHKGQPSKHDPGHPVRQLFHRLRSKAIEPFNALFKKVFEGGGQVPVQGVRRTQLIVLGAILLYQLVWLYQFEHQLPLRKAIKPLLKAA
jgi:hypothetical protein